VMKGKAKLFRILCGLITIMPVIAEAHPLHWASDAIGFWAGLFHPLGSLEHIIALLAVGVWISLGSRQTVRFMPLMYVTLMLIGGSLAIASFEWPYAEWIMGLSVLTLVTTLILGINTASSLSVLAFANMAVLYGYLHAYEILLDFSAIAYAGGFALATLVLILCGVALKCFVSRFLSKYMSVRSVKF